MRYVGLDSHWEAIHDLRPRPPGTKTAESYNQRTVVQGRMIEGGSVGPGSVGFFQHDLGRAKSTQEYAAYTAWLEQYPDRKREHQHARS